MIARLVLVATGVVAAAVGAAMWAKRRAVPRPSRRIRNPAVVGKAVVGKAVVGPADPSASEAGDNLQAIKGIGGVSEQRLSAAGVTTFAEIAGWSDDDVERVAKDIKVSAERIRREDWVGQARTLSKA